jgi:hypothetical protein
MLHTRAPVSAPALAPAIVGAFYLRKASGSLAILTAIRRASSRVDQFTDERPTDSSARKKERPPRGGLS